MPSSSLTVVCLQLNSLHGDLARNTQRVQSILASLEQQHAHSTIDLLVLPELALSGYVFDGYEDIEPLLEHPHQGPTFHLASSIARRLGCHVIAGFPERGNTEVGEQPHDDHPSPTTSSVSTPYDARPTSSRSPDPIPHAGRAYNSAILLSPSGAVEHIFHKHFLYEDDKRWSTPGDGFQTLSLFLPRLQRSVKLCVAICMDLNPYDFTAPFDAFELARFCRRAEVEVLVVPMAWLLPRDEVERWRGNRKPSNATIEYWALRCLPIYSDAIDEPVPAEVDEADEADEEEEANAARQQQQRRHHQTYLVTANRSGEERGSVFAGSSCVLRLPPRDGGGRAQLLGALGVDQEGVLAVSIDLGGGEGEGEEGEGEGKGETGGG